MSPRASWRAYLQGVRANYQTWKKNVQRDLNNVKAAWSDFRNGR